MVGNMTNIPPVPCMGTPTHYGIYGIYTMPFFFDLLGVVVQVSLYHRKPYPVE